MTDFLASSFTVSPCGSQAQSRAQRGWMAWLGGAALGLALMLAGCASPSVDNSPSATAERLYKEARDDMNAGSYERAIKSMERVEGLAAGTLIAQQATLDMAYMHWRSSDRVQALSTVDRFIKLNPSSPALDYAMYLRGLVNFNESRGFMTSLTGQDYSERDQRASKDAFVAFQQLVEQFPNSRYSDDARGRMTHIVDALAAYEVHVARYYFRRGAYVAAAARAQAAVTEFPRSAALEEALHIMVQSYDKLQLTQLKEGAERVLKLNFPDSNFNRSGSLSGSKPWWRLW